MDQNKVEKWLKKSGNNFCAMPFIHMAIEANGDIKPCCMADEFDLNIRDKTIQQAYNHPSRLQFIESFKRNEQHPLCKVCWKNPEIRTSFSTKPNSIEVTKQAMNGITPKHELKWLEIKPGNRCNLKCRICGVHNSSSWAKDDAALTSSNKKFKDSSAYKYTQSCDWIDDLKFWNDVNELESIKYIHFMGGEPYMVPEHFQLLRTLVDHPTIDTSNITIKYNTNGTYFPSSENLSLYENFKEIEIAISIDDIGKRFNYQRKLADWKTVQSNLIKFKKLQSNKKNIRVGIDPTISVFNIFYLNEITQEFDRLGYYESLRNHYVYKGPYAIHVMPKYIKDIITEKYKHSNNKWIRKSVKYMNSLESDAELWQRFKQKTAKLDSLRQEKFYITFKEFHKTTLFNSRK